MVESIARFDGGSVLVQEEGEDVPELTSGEANVEGEECDQDGTLLVREGDGRA